MQETSALRSVLDNVARSGMIGTPKHPPRWRILTVLVVLGSILLAAPVFGQATQNTTIQPDCLIPFTFTAAGNFPATPTTNGAGDNRTKGCAAWTLMYQNTGMTSVSVTLQSGSSVSTTVSFGSFAGTVSTGFVNPIVSDTGGSLQAVNGTADISWVRVNVAATGSGTLTGVLYGFRNSSAAVNSGGGGGLCPGGSVYDIQFSDGTNCDADTGSFDYNKTALTTPAAPMVTKTCTPAGMETCMTDYGYTVSAFIYGLCCTPGSAEGTVALAADTLSMTNFNHVVTAAVTGSTGCIVWRSTGGDFGAIWTGDCGSAFNDTGLATNLLYPGADYPGFSTNGTAGFFSARVAQFGNDPLDSQLAHDSIFDVTYKLTDSATIGLDSGIISTFSTVQDPDGDSNFVTTLGVQNFLGGNHNYGSTERGILGKVDFRSSGTLAQGIGILGIADMRGTGNATTFIGMSGAAQTNSAGSVGNVQGVHGWAGCYAGMVTNCISFYAEAPSTGATISGLIVAYFNENVGAGGFSWYSQGGTGHFETGATGNVGVEIERISMQTADLFQLLDSNGTTKLSFFDASGSEQILADVATPFIIGKMTASASAPGAGKADMRWVAGTNMGTCKLVSNAGTSATEVTIVDNVGGGC